MYVVGADRHFCMLMNCLPVLPVLSPGGVVWLAVPTCVLETLRKAMC